MKQKKEICVEFEEIKSYEHRWSTQLLMLI